MRRRAIPSSASEQSSYLYSAFTLLLSRLLNFPQSNSAFSRTCVVIFFLTNKNLSMGLTNWDEVLPAFDRAFEEMRKIHLQSKETALNYLRELGLLDPEEEDDAENNTGESRGAESTL